MLHSASAGDNAAEGELFNAVYGELGGLARSKLSRESTLTMPNPTSIAHES